ncbi:hypothetical protein MYSTI_06996 [Myxococcus stipitatus DSM 14675]|uniref:Uncharacterized protein n=1 Tax=Myxococcus stipitatus (strain DSM 14675 / JCM 12634 / Mx s8) TaxID=1278073 RepID=L7UJU0_MYXSD|nr:hypothetical protein [Myxococcus stipitatus]AGC48268.1 hypothetical protein MYSTI_06996 [Myxococcus stipitatus DSM 14675]
MTIDELERCIVRLLRNARQRGIERIETRERDYYWTVPWPDWTDMTKVPEPGVGSFDDDILELTKILEDPDRDSSVDLDRAASLLHLIADDMANAR